MTLASLICQKTPTVHFPLFWFAAAVFFNLLLNLFIFFLLCSSTLLGGRGASQSLPTAFFLPPPPEPWSPLPLRAEPSHPLCGSARESELAAEVVVPSKAMYSWGGCVSQPWQGLPEQNP